jgi:starvation-inducible DNA-binding protein
MPTFTDHPPSTTGGGFTAGDRLGDHLRQILVDLIALQLQAKQAHWNVVGRNFRDVHLQLDEITDISRDAADTIAERMRGLGKVADGRAPTVAGTARLTPLPLGELGTPMVVVLRTDGMRAVVADIRRFHDDIDVEDPSTSELLHGMVVESEKRAWMLGAENRVAR